MKPSSTLLTATLALMAATAGAYAAPLIAVDFNDRQTTDVSDTAPGFSPYLLPGTSASVTVGASQLISGYTVTLTPFDDGQDENLTTAGVQNTAAAIDDRDRATPVDSGAFTYGQLYDDVIFAGGSAGFTGGMDLSVTGGSLLPNTQYLVSLYAFDSGSNTGTQPRSANWTDLNNGDALVVATSFNGANLPTTDDQYKFTGIATTDATGTLLIRGRNSIPLPTTGGVTQGVFLNGFEINPVPEPTTLAACGVALLPAMLRRRRSQTR
jgi:hypothetical protein